MAPATKPGAYTETVRGNNGPLSIQAVFGTGRIADIKLVSSAETSGIGDVAFSKVRERVLATQSFNVDSVSGATITSSAVKYALRKAAKDAGYDSSSFSAKFAAKIPAPQSIVADVAVLGSGGAGMAAAIEAARAGAKVVVLEKLGRTGGSSRTSSAMILVGGSKLQKEAGISDSTEALKKYWLDRGEGKVDKAMVEFAADKANDELQFLMDMGVGYSSKLILQSGTATVNRAHIPPAYGAELMDRMSETAKALGIEVYTDTRATSLILDGGKIVGVKALREGGDFTVKAKAVVIATGGFDHNADMVAKYSPKAVGAWAVSAPQNTGDGIEMGMAVGADTVFKGGVIGWKVVNPAFGHTTMEGRPIYGLANLVVDAGGKRFTDESEDYPFFFDAMASNGSSQFFYIYDSGADKTETLEAVTSTLQSLDAAVKAGVAYKADSIQDLAAAASIPGLQSSVGQFNGAIAAGKDAAFGRDVTTMKRIGQGPFYALRCQRATLGSFGGLKIDLKGEVLDKSGKAIPGLFAAGEVANGDFFSDVYPASGSSLGMAIIFGREAGKSAAAAIK